MSVIHTTLDQPAVALDCAKKDFSWRPTTPYRRTEFALGMAYMFNREVRAKGLQT